MTLAAQLRDLADAADAGALGRAAVERLTRALDCPALRRQRRDYWIRAAAEHVPDVAALHALLVGAAWRWRHWAQRYGGAPDRALPAEIAAFRAYAAGPLPQSERQLRNVLRGNGRPRQFPPGVARVEPDAHQQEADTWPAA
jgi:hypothetical protein